MKASKSSTVRWTYEQYEEAWKLWTDNREYSDWQGKSWDELSSAEQSYANMYVRGWIVMHLELGHKIVLGDNYCLDFE